MEVRVVLVLCKVSKISFQIQCSGIAQGMEESFQQAPRLLRSLGDSRTYVY